MEEEAVPRRINYLRMSITDRCQLRCFYCTYWQDWEKLPCREILSYEELLRVAGIAAAMGIRKVRVTGGEPLVRRGVVGFLHHLHRVPGIEEVCLTTNGVLLADLASAIYDTGFVTLTSAWTRCAGSATGKSPVRIIWGRSWPDLSGLELWASGP